MRNIKSYEPTEALLFTGRRVYGLAGLVLVLGIASYWWHVLAIIAMGVAMLGRFTISMQEKLPMKQDQRILSHAMMGSLY